MYTFYQYVEKSSDRYLYFDQYIRRNLCDSYCSQDTYERLPFDTYTFYQHVRKIDTIERYIIGSVNRYPWSAPTGCNNYQSKVITSNNRPPVDMGSYRLTIDLEPVFRGVLLRSRWTATLPCTRTICLVPSTVEVWRQLYPISPAFILASSGLPCLLQWSPARPLFTTQKIVCRESFDCSKTLGGSSMKHPHHRYIRMWRSFFTLVDTPRPSCHSRVRTLSRASYIRTCHPLCNS